MPAEQTYERQLGPRAPVAMPLATPEQYGAGLGAAIADAGEALHRAELRAYGLQRQQTADQEAADFDHRFALYRQNMGDISREARSTAPEGAAGHAQRMREALDAGREATLGSVAEDSVRRRAQGQWDEFATRFIDGEADFEEGKRVGKLVTDTKSATDISANLARRDPTAYKSELSHRLEAIDGLSIDADSKAKLARETEQVVAIGFLNGVTDRTPALTRELIDKGTFDSVLTPEQLDQLRNGAEVELRRVEAAAHQQQTQAKAEFSEELQTTRELIGQGRVVDDAALRRLEASAGALGDDSSRAVVQGWRAENKLAKIYQQQTPLQMEQRLTALAAKGDKIGDGEAIERKWIQDHIGARTAQFNSDPAGTLARAGANMPPLDFTKPDTISQRVRWAKVQSKATGYPVPVLTANEAKAFAAQKASGRAGMLGTMEALGRLPGSEAQAAARQIDPNDKQFQHLVTLPDPYRRLAIEGRAALQGKRVVLDPSKTDYSGKGGTNDEKLFADQDRAFFNVLRVLPGDQRQAIAATAMEIFAGVVEAGDPLSAPTRWKALNLALGAVGNGPDQKGGMAVWGDSVFLLPEKSTARAFTQIVRGEVLARGAEARPVNPDGSAFDLFRAHPVLVGKGIYEFRSKGGRSVLQKDGKPFRVRAGDDGAGP